MNEMTESELFAGQDEKPGSQMAYQKEREVSRRQFNAAKQLGEIQKAVAEKQILASVAVIKNAFWIRLSAISVLVATTVAVVSFGLKLN